MRTYFAATIVKIEHADDPVGADTLQRWGLSDLTDDQTLELRAFDVLSQEDRNAVIVAGMKKLYPRQPDEPDIEAPAGWRLVVSWGAPYIRSRSIAHLVDATHPEIAVARCGAIPRGSWGIYHSLNPAGAMKCPICFDPDPVQSPLTSDPASGSNDKEAGDSDAVRASGEVSGSKLRVIPLSRPELRDLVWGITPRENIHLIENGNPRAVCGINVLNSWVLNAPMAKGQVCQKCINKYNVSRAIPYRLDYDGNWLNPEMKRK